MIRDQIGLSRGSGVKEFKTTYPGDFHLKDDDFLRTGKYEQKAASVQEWGIYETNAHADGGEPRDAALAALRWIMAQGEGPNAIEKSHFYRNEACLCSSSSGHSSNPCVFCGQATA
jgi:hypothetical protein